MTNVAPIYNAVRADQGYDPAQVGDYSLAKYLRLPPPETIPIFLTNATARIRTAPKSPRKRKAPR